MRITDGAEYWDRIAASYAAGRRFSAVDQAVLAAAPPGGAVLEIGAGPGVFTREALAHSARSPGDPYTATDVSPAFCAMLSALPVEVICRDHRSLSFPDASFDAVYAMATLHHLSAQGCVLVLQKITRWLKPGGALALVEDWAFRPEGEVQTHLVALRSALRGATDPGERHPSEEEWEERLCAAGLTLSALRHAPRPEDLGRYEALDDPDSQRRLAWLRQRAPYPEIPMSILIARRAP